MSVDQTSDKKIATLGSIADLMEQSADSYTVNVSYMIDWVANEHTPPVTCSNCVDPERDTSYPCFSYENALSVAFAWLLRTIEDLD